MLTSQETRLQRITKLTTKQVELFKEGVAHETAFGASLDDVLARTVADRLALADSFIRMAERMERSRSDLSRPAIARYYYAMYHAMRAAAFQFHGGDDHEQHTVLSVKGVPHDFPSRTIAANDLKDARALRNEADYDQYPSNQSYFRNIVRGLGPVAKPFVVEARAYIRAKGNSHA
ncbi:hypothetical protein [Curtobacterium flaccumfaciens]|uniref:hypothetical protein n=1 Tax=Curtobacterium flaccumfaciens TaxID=2035 RepID=UPI001BDF2F94|nr:hypothetical protein [Curtobacterium flaccumfaciens]MBT1606944.1 hypothetical protein [Curtobacterium flaccumfaciens pv. betae]MBT1656707.1 hypothetical protein [Curtobacterium flaccumfaciens pv. betae]MCS0472600.1 hypothetical protein [Curtobacterium flaccumfaciens pv. betae]MCS0475506.1 hypothetical protein [Curtobacterium flaccumfaciens pv. betae]MCS0479340.1 hypothetical protein [Curtobacterium flaccumfaciens pv. betae]